ncbi:unnamed protein product, partial [Urochloa humidicola]
GEAPLEIRCCRRRRLVAVHPPTAPSSSIHLRAAGHLPPAPWRHLPASAPTSTGSFCRWYTGDEGSRYEYNPPKAPV